MSATSSTNNEIELDAQILFEKVDRKFMQKLYSAIPEALEMFKSFRISNQKNPVVKIHDFCTGIMCDDLTKPLIIKMFDAKYKDYYMPPYAHKPYHNNIRLDIKTISSLLLDVC
jgi:hypothetical protein